MKFFITIFGWVVWNYFEFYQEKNKIDEQSGEFGYVEYFKKKWDNWVWSLLVGFSLLIVGYMEWGLDAMQMINKDWGWHDIYYLGSGVISEAVAFVYRRWRGQTLADKK